ncbi:MAG: hypothetical protein IKY01_01680 [Prevotella sp.]|nr:hypothetical protein [Prevotella sp.]
MQPYDLKKPFDMYKEAVERKPDSAEKRELQSCESQMRDCYANYDRHFAQNDLEYMLHARVGVDHKDALLGLYGSKVKLVKDFRKRYFEINPQTYNNLCPYCVINSSNTTEHILPKDPYPEFAVDVKNLIPGCSECNSAKGEDVLDEHGKKLVINYYTDLLPDEQFLKVTITRKGFTLNFKYYLDNPENRIAPDLYALIDRHFEKLHLLTRYKEKAIQEFGEIKNTYLAEQFVDEAAYDAFAAKQIRKCNLDAVEYGRNHWKVVLTKSCAESKVFKQYILT